MKKEDLTFTYNHFGYMIQYKGNNIGGAGTDGTGKRTGANLKLFRELAKSEIQSIINGHIDEYKLKEINKIDSAIREISGEMYDFLREFVNPKLMTEKQSKQYREIMFQKASELIKL